MRGKKGMVTRTCGGCLPPIIADPLPASPEIPNEISGKEHEPGAGRIDSVISTSVKD